MARCSRPDARITDSPTQRAVYNANNQLTQWGTTAMTYDANGSTLSDGTNTYVWDARNRLVSADNNGASFSYDPLGRRVAKTVLSTSTSFLYDGANPVQELNGATPTANLLTGGVDERFQRVSSTETDDYLTDALGSTVALTDSTGASQVQYSYAPYGSMSITGTTTNSYAYTGREFDGLGINYYRARYYNPATGRFLSEDPIGFAGGINEYAYVADSPLNFIDPSGMDKKQPCSGLNCIPWPLLGMAGFGGPRGNPQFNACQGCVNYPGPETPPPALVPSGPVVVPPVEETPMQQLVRLLGKALSNASDGLDLMGKDIIVCFTCNMIQYPGYPGMRHGYSGGTI